MSGTQRLSPRQEALDAILLTRAELDATLVSEAAWEKLVAVAWDNRSHAGERRDIRREVRNVLHETGRGEGDSGCSCSNLTSPTGDR